MAFGKKEKQKQNEWKRMANRIHSMGTRSTLRFFVLLSYTRSMCPRRHPH
jgi:hypothetical protein